MEASSQSTTDITFTNIQDRYRRGDTIEFDLEWSKEPNNHSLDEGDWIGLFKVGWKSEEDCQFRQNISDSKSVDGFSLPIPKETSNETTYQLCYMNHKNRLVAVSRSFTILPLDADGTENDYDWLDLFNVQGDVVVVSRQNNVETPPRSFEDLMAANMTLDSQLSCMKIEKDTISTLLAQSEHSKQALDTELTEVRAENKAKASQIDGLELEIQSMTVKLSSYESRLATLLEKLSNTEEINNEYSLAAVEASTEKTLLKDKITDLETAIENSAAETAELKDMLNQSNDDLQNANIVIGELKQQINTLKSDLNSLEHNDDAIRASLTYSLNIFKKKNDDAAQILNYSTSLECAKRVEVEAKMCIDALTVQNNQICDLQEIINVLQEESKSYREEVQRLEHTEHQEEAKNYEVTDSVLALQVAHDHLQEAYNDAVKKGRLLYRQLSDTKSNLKSVTDSNAILKQQVTDLYTRLDMSKEAYKEKYIECCRLQNELQIFKSNLSVHDGMQQNNENALKEALQVEKERLLSELSRKDEQLKTFQEKSEQEMNSVIQEIAACHDSLEQKQSKIDSLKAENLRLRQEVRTADPYACYNQ